MKNKKLTVKNKIICDIELLNNQIFDLLKSNTSEYSKCGLHHFLGEIFSALEDKKSVTIYREGN